MARHSIPDIIERAEPRQARVQRPGAAAGHEPRPVAAPVAVDEEPHHLRRAAVRPAAAATRVSVAAHRQALARVRDLLRAVGRRLSRSTTSPTARPIAAIRSSGTGRSRPARCPVPAALATAAVLGVGRAGGGVLAAAGVRRCSAPAYVGLLALYSGPLKHVVIIDVLTIAIGFVLRAAAGAVVIDVPISHWLLILTILLALFLALSKRRHELVLLADGATGHRPILRGIQPVPARPDDLGGHRVDARGLRRSTPSAPRRCRSSTPTSWA